MASAATLESSAVPVAGAADTIAAAGLSLYAEALGLGPSGTPPPPPPPPPAEISPLTATADTITPAPPTAKAADVEIVSGYRPGLLARMLEMHMEYYSRAAGLGLEFETSLAAGMANLLERLDRPGNGAWAAVHRLPSGDERIVGTIFIDGEHEAQAPSAASEAETGAAAGETSASEKKATARVRCFIVDEHLRGAGVGRRLVTAAMDFVRARGFDEAELWTMPMLRAACRLYEAAGFELVLDKEVERWGRPATLRLYSWRRKRRPVVEGGGESAAEKR